MSKILENLFLGDIATSTNHKFLKQSNIRAMIIIGTEIHPFHTRGFVHMKINAEDKPDFDLKKHFNEVSAFLHKNLQKGGVLVYCYYGASRSASVVLAYLIKYQRISLKRAFDTVNAKRKIQPNEGFMRQLEEYYQEQVCGKKTLKFEMNTSVTEQRNREDSHRASEMLAKYMNRREASTSVTKQYINYLKVFQKLSKPLGKRNRIVGKKPFSISRDPKKRKSLTVDKEDLAFTRSKLVIRTMEKALKEDDKAIHSKRKNKDKSKPKKNSFSLNKSGMILGSRYMSCEKDIELDPKRNKSQNKGGSKVLTKNFLLHKEGAYLTQKKFALRNGLLKDPLRRSELLSERPYDFNYSKSNFKEEKSIDDLAKNKSNHVTFQNKNNFYDRSYKYIRSRKDIPIMSPPTIFLNNENKHCTNMYLKHKTNSEYDDSRIFNKIDLHSFASNIQKGQRKNKIETKCSISPKKKNESKFSKEFPTTS